MAQRLKDIYFPLNAAWTDDTRTANSALRELAKRLLAVGKAALQAEKQLLRFDEINRLEASLLDLTEKTTGSKSGSSKSGSSKTSSKTTDSKKPSPHSSTSHSGTSNGEGRAKPSPHSKTTHGSTRSTDIAALLGFDPAELRRPSGHSSTTRGGAARTSAGNLPTANLAGTTGSAAASIPFRIDLAAKDILFKWEGLN